MKTMIFRFRDQIEAETQASEFLAQCTPTNRPYSSEIFSLVKFSKQLGNGRIPVEGSVVCAWCGTNLIAQSVIVRDDANNSVLTCIDLRGEKENG